MNEIEPIYDAPEELPPEYFQESASAPADGYVPQAPGAELPLSEPPRKRFTRKKRKGSSDKPATLSDEALGRIVPASIEAEACVLGSMILDENAIDTVVDLIKPDFFHRPAHEQIFRTLLEMHQERKPIDLVTIKDELNRQKKLESVGGIEYIVAIVEGVPGVSNVEYYANIVRDKALLRGLISASKEILSEAYDSTDEPRAVIDRAEKLVFELTQQQVGTEAVGLRDLLNKTFEEIQNNDGKAITGLATGYHKLDEMTAGFHPEEMIILAARPSMGKTTLLMNLAEYMCVTDRQPIAFFSLEMSRMQITQRLLASYAQVDLGLMRRGMVSPENFTRLQNAAADLYDAKFLIDDSAMLTPLQLRAKARRMKAQHDIKAIFIDYLQLMTADAIGKGGGDKRHEQIGAMSRGIKALSRELKIPIVAAAQLNRGPADRPSHTPRMSDLRESGSIEQDADVVMLLHNEDYYHRGDPDYVPENKTHLILEKQRNGPTGVVYLHFRPEITRFENAAPEYVAAQ